MPPFVLADFLQDIGLVFFLTIVFACWWMTQTIKKVSKAAGPFAAGAAKTGLRWWLTH